MAGQLIQGPVVVPIGTTIFIGGRLRLTPVPGGVLLDGSDGSSASPSEIIGGTAGRVLVDNGSTAEWATSLDLAGGIVSAAGIDSGGSISAAGQIIAGSSVNGGSNGFNCTDMVGGAAPLFNIDATNAVVCTNLNADLLDGQHLAYTLDLANATGTLPDARFPATLPAASGVNLTALNASNLGSGTVPDARFPATLPALSGVNLTALNASNIASGNLAYARMPTGTGAFDIGSGNTLTFNRTWLHTGPFTHQRASGVLATFETSTAADGRLEFKYNSSRIGILNMVTGGVLLALETDSGIGLRIQAASRNLGFYGVTPVARPAALTQTYATADRTHAARTAAALTDSTAGTPGTTLAALTALTDSPATADALRDELMSVWAPILRNWAASLADQHNKLNADHLDTAQFANVLADDLQSLGLEQ